MIKKLRYQKIRIMVCKDFDLIWISFSFSELYTPDQWEIDKDSVTLDKLIGQGHFGQVYQGVLKLSDGNFKTCAVKVRAFESSRVAVSATCHIFTNEIF